MTKRRSKISLDTPRALIDVLIDAFDRALVASAPIADLSLLAEAREIFLNGGAAALERATNPRSWLQVGVRFADDAQRRTFLDATLADAVEDWRKRGLVSEFFYMNKPPGVRLRFCGPRVHDKMQRLVFAFLDRRKRGGMLAGYELGVYDGETYQFGGEAGLELFHRFSTIDCLSILRLLSTSDEGALPGISLLLLNHLVRQLSSGDWEVWDVWCNMRLAKRQPALNRDEHRLALATFETYRPLLEPIVFAPEQAIAGLTPEEQRLVRTHFTSIEAWARHAQSVVRSGELLYGMRKILPFYVIFHWNRMGIHIQTQCSLVFYMQQLLDPKKDQRKVRRGGAKDGKRSGSRPKLRS